MKYSEFSEKMLAPVNSSMEEKQQLSQKVADLMGDNRSPNINVNVIVGSQNELPLDQSALLSKKEYIQKMQSEDASVKFDENGKPIKGSGDAYSKKGSFDKDGSDCYPGTASGDLVIFKKDDQGNLIKVPKDGGLKTPNHQQQFERHFLNF